MSTVVWRGGALAVAQVNTFTLGGTWEVGDLIRVTVGSKTKDYAVTSTVVATIASAFATWWNALTDAPEIEEITASANSADVVLTAETAGVPFTATLTPLESNGSAADAQTIAGVGTATTGTATTASSGPNDWNTAKNWSTGSVPIDADTIVIDKPDSEIFYGLDQSAIQPAELRLLSPRLKLGLPLENEGEYPEYRDTYLRIGPTTCLIRTPDSERAKVDFGADQTAVTVEDSGTGEDEDTPAILLKGTHASNALTVLRGQVGVAFFGGESATLLTLTMGERGGGDGDASVVLGSGVTLGTVTKKSGSLLIQSAVATSLTQEFGSTAILGSGAVAQLTLNGGVVVYSTSGTLGGNTFVGPGGLIDFSQDLRAKTVTNVIESSTPNPVNDPFKVVASLIIDFNNVDALDGSLGRNCRITRAATA